MKQQLKNQKKLSIPLTKFIFMFRTRKELHPHVQISVTIELDLHTGEMSFDESKISGKNLQESLEIISPFVERSKIIFKSQEDDQPCLFEFIEVPNFKIEYNFKANKTREKKVFQANI